MKKFLVLLLGALMVLGFAATSFAIHDEAAEIEAGAAFAVPGTAFVFGGDARVRGVKKTNYDLDDKDGNDEQYWDSRARFTIDAKTAGGIELRTRMTLGNNGGNYNWGETNTKTVNWDWAYIHAPLGFVPVTVDVGNQRANWAHKFFVWDSPADRLKLSGTFGNVKVSIGTDKVSEATGDNEDADGDAVGGDYDKYFGTVGTSFGDWNVNLLYISYQDGRPTTDDADCVGVDGIPGTVDDTCATTGDDANGSVWDLWVDGKIGPVGAHLEYVQKNGELFETEDIEGHNGDPHGAYVAFDYATAQFVVFGAYAFTRDGYIADNDFAPNLFFGTVNNTAAGEYGFLGDMDAIVVGGTYNINEALGVGGRITSAKVEEFLFDLDASGDITDGTIGAWEVQGAYKISKNLNYSLAYGQATFSGDVFEDAEKDTAAVWYNALNYKF